MNDDELATLIPAARAPGIRRGWRCPDDGELAAWVEGKIPESRRETLGNHLADCDYCCGQAGFLSRARELGPPPAVPVALLAAARGERPPLFARLRPATLVAAGAGLVLALLVASPWGRPGLVSGGPGPEPAVRAVRGPAEAPWIVHPSEGAVVPRAALELRWEEAPDALFYTVQLVDPNGDVAWEGRADGARLAIPPAAPRRPPRPRAALLRLGERPPPERNDREVAGGGLPTRSGIAPHRRGEADERAVPPSRPTGRRRSGEPPRL